MEELLEDLDLGQPLQQPLLLFPCDRLAVSARLYLLA
jgi:hypothetical protein